MKISKILGSIVFVLFFKNADSQALIDSTSQGYYIDALTNSRTTATGGTARNVGMAGVQTALGADLGSLSSNPAGLGVYRRSEAAGGFALILPASTSSLFNKNTSDIKSNLIINNFGIAFNNIKDDIVESDWRGGTFAFSMNTLQSYHNTFSYEGVNNRTSAINSYISQATGTNAQVFDKEYETKNITSIPSLAYNAFLITVDTSQIPYYGLTRYYGYIPPDKVMNQKGTVTSSGAVRSWAFGYGANYRNKLYLGASLGIMSIKRNVDQTYTERLLNGGSGYLNDFTFSDSYKVRGTGVNLTIGAIYRINDMFRVGASIKTPEIYSINEEYNASLTANFNDITLSYSNGSPYQLVSETANLTTTKFNYQLYTPLKANLGGAVFFNKAGFISVEGEYINYRGMLLSKRGSSIFSGDNNTIRNIYRDVINLRAGAEFRFDIFRIRGGFAAMPSPYATETNDLFKRTVSDNTTIASLGAGIKTETFFIDLAFSRTNYTSHYSPYVLPDNSQPLVRTNNGINSIVITVGGSF